MQNIGRSFHTPDLRRSISTPVIAVTCPTPSPVSSFSPDRAGAACAKAALRLIEKREVSRKD
jgi:hypothetical protein